MRLRTLFLFFVTAVFVLSVIRLVSVEISSRRSPSRHCVQESTKRDIHVEVTPFRLSERDHFVAPTQRLARTWTFLVFPIIDWTFRFQRPQQFAKGLAESGFRVYYFFVRSERTQAEATRYRLQKAHDNLWLVSLNCDFGPIYNLVPEKTQLLCVEEAIDTFLKEEKIGSRIVLVQYPHWWYVVKKILYSLLVYDCMDFHPGFDLASQLSEAERLLLSDADLVITSSQSLSQVVGVDNVLLRNAAEYGHFANAKPDFWKMPGPIVGYVGAISHWFDAKLVAAAAKRHPDWTFILVGAHSDAKLDALAGLDNVIYKYEQPYDAIPDMIMSFDVCIIPFMPSHPLSTFTNPVKMYEYLSAGKPIVSSNLLEVKLVASKLVHIALEDSQFPVLLEKAMSERHSKIKRNERQQWAQSQSWSSRVSEMLKQIALRMPLVSVVILTSHDNDGLDKCLESLLHTYYHDFEVIVINNNVGSEAAKSILQSYAQRFVNMHILTQPVNTGFAGGNNIGIRASQGEFVVLLNSDTVVTPGWLLGLVHHFRKDPSLGVLGAVTNRIGNEAMLHFRYSSNREMHQLSAAYVKQHRFERFYTKNVAFFCAMFPRDVFDVVGLLDEKYGMGWFEDDDFNRRLRLAGYRVAFAEDVFIEHALSKSMNQIDVKAKKELFDRNKMYFESKWGPWEPHTDLRSSKENVLY